MKKAQAWKPDLGLVPSVHILELCPQATHSTVMTNLLPHWIKKYLRIRGHTFGCVHEGISREDQLMWGRDALSVEDTILRAGVPDRIKKKEPPTMCFLIC